MKRLCLYAHYGRRPQVDGHVLFHLQRLAELGFRICFVSNSEISPASEAAVRKVCERVIVRENTGLDFCMWQRAMAEYDLLQLEELLLTNSSIIGPLAPLAPVWERRALAGCDFWGLTDNDEFKPHLSSYFLVFRQRVLHSERFREFWRAVLPYQDKWQVIYAYELGLTEWLQEGGFQWRPAFSQRDITDAYRARLSLWQKYRGRMTFLKHLYRNRQIPPRNITTLYPDVLLQRGMPYLKATLLHQKSMRMTPAAAFALLEKSPLPAEVVAELHETYPIS